MKFMLRKCRFKGHNKIKSNPTPLSKADGHTEQIPLSPVPYRIIKLLQKIVWKWENKVEIGS